MFELFILAASLIILGLLVLLGLALFVVSLIRKQKSFKTVGLIAFLCFACFFVSVGVYTGKRAIDKGYATAYILSDKTKTIAREILIEGGSIIWTDDRTYLVGQDPNPQVLLLKSYVPEAVRPSINPQFYTYFGFRDWWRFPLVYPYSVETVDIVDLGCLTDDSAVKDYAADTNKYDSLGICGITHIALDKDYLLMRVQSDNVTERGQIKFIIFNFNTREKQTFDSEDTMFEKAKELGFKGKLELLTLREYDALF